MTTVREKILLAAAVGVRWSHEFAIRPDAITMIAWRMFPESFGLGRFKNESANHNAVIAKLSGVDGLVARGWLRPCAAEVGLYVVTRKGLAHAAQLLPAHAAEAALAPPGAISDERAPGRSTEDAPPPPPPPPPPPKARAPRRPAAPPRRPASLPPPSAPPPLSVTDAVRAEALVRAYDLAGFARGRPVDDGRARLAWGLVERNDPENQRRMRDFESLVARVVASSHLRAADRGLLLSLHGVVVRRSGAWLAARGVVLGPPAG